MTINKSELYLKKKLQKTINYTDEEIEIQNKYLELDNKITKCIETLNNIKKITYCKDDLSFKNNKNKIKKLNKIKTYLNKIQNDIDDEKEQEYIKKLKAEKEKSQILIIKPPPSKDGGIIILTISRRNSKESF